MAFAEDTQTQKSGDTRADVLAAAAKNFREKGYAAVSLREIARTAGLTTGSLYYHFGSKEEVVRAVLIEGHENCHALVAAAVAAIPDQSDYRGKLRAGLMAHLEALFGEDNLIPANMQIFSQLPHEMRKPAMASRKAYEAFWSNLLEEAQNDGTIRQDLDITVVLPLMFGALNWTIEWAKRDTSRVEIIAGQIMTMLAAE